MSTANKADNELSRLESLKRLNVLDTEAEVEFDALVKAASLVCDVPISLICLVDDKRQWLKANIGLSGVSETAHDFAFCAQAIHQNGILEVNDATQDARFSDNPLVTGNPNVRFYAGVTLKLSDGSNVGTLCVIDTKPNQLNDKQRETLSQLAVAASIALERRRIIEIEESLKESEQQFQQIIDNQSVATFMIDSEHRITNWNKACEVLTGAKASDMIGGTEPWRAFYESLRPCLADLVLDKLQNHVSNYYPSAARSLLVENGLHAEAWFENLGGKRRYMIFDAAPIFDLNGNITAVVQTLQDITEQKTTEDTLRFIAEESWVKHGIDFLESLCFYLSKTLKVEHVIIAKISEDPMSADTHVFYSLGKILNNFSYNLEGTPCAEVMDNKICIYFNNVTELYPQDTALKELKADGYIGGPIWSADGKKIGLISLISTHPISDTTTAISVLNLVLNKVESEILRQESEHHIWHQANYDALTNLSNRRMFQERLEIEFSKAKRHSHKMALLVLDIDKFKEVNDTHGHQIGDELLKQVAQRINQCVRDTDTLARLGGDEFTILMNELTNLESVERLATSIINEVNNPFVVGNEHINISISVGITIYPNDSTDIEELKRNADQAMYDAKSSGRNCYRFFTRSMQEAINKRILLSKKLQNALTEDQFSLVYQPILNVCTGKITKAEALIRWHHPELGLIMPSEFISLAEDTRLIIPIGDWVFRQACNNVHQLRQTYNPEFQISVNKSPLQFRTDDNYCLNWFEYIAKMGLSGDAIVIEITETSLLHANEDIHLKFENLRSNGFQVALDDFGTGYSAMAYLNKFEIDYLKIDRSFVMNLAKDSQDIILCEAMILMAHKLGMQVIAEGVENVDQLNLLKSIGVDFCQGYLISRPVPFEELNKLLSQDDFNWQN